MKITRIGIITLLTLLPYIMAVRADVGVQLNELVAVMKVIKEPRAVGETLPEDTDFERLLDDLGGKQETKRFADMALSIIEERDKGDLESAAFIFERLSKAVDVYLMPREQVIGELRTALIGYNTARENMSKADMWSKVAKGAELAQAMRELQVAYQNALGSPALRGELRELTEKVEKAFVGIDLSQELTLATVGSFLASLGEVQSAVKSLHDEIMKPESIEPADPAPTDPALGDGDRPDEDAASMLVQYGPKGAAVATALIIAGFGVAKRGTIKKALSRWYHRLRGRDTISTKPQSYEHEGFSY